MKELTVEETMRRYPRITANIIAESLGYATPTCMARILKDEILVAISELEALSPEELVEKRLKKFRKMGEYLSEGPIR